ncbi:hypothetical protein B5C34_07250 [Pacificimonas flava]|uniref:J domain-containing protein n=2 Tax=Pacificimonas TaxID=1960290 RepID=A0A219B4K2_9SPHN|nr:MULTISPECIES: molecular chaperone DnaJ [Pacificimonas]MBZ6379538.1 hypothetical protein [Pacificimonas aurantium]OWV33277.1 hypothetical protein B5C34_07250 [Pacificimonas flava]
MGPLLVILLGAVAVFWWLGLLTPERLRIIGGIGGLLIGLLLTLRGAPFAGIPLAGAGGYLVWSARRAPDGQLTVKEARRLLGVGPGADEAEIRSAYRLAMASAHPDRGGSTANSAKLNEARDLLLKQAIPRSRRPDQ